MPSLVGSEALHKSCNLGGEVGLELGVGHLEVIQQLLSQRCYVALVHQRIHQVKRPPVNSTIGNLACMIGWAPLNKGVSKS